MVNIFTAQQMQKTALEQLQILIDRLNKDQDKLIEYSNNPKANQLWVNARQHALNERAEAIETLNKVCNSIENLAIILIKNTKKKAKQQQFKEQSTKSHLALNKEGLRQYSINQAKTIWADHY